MPFRAKSGRENWARDESTAVCKCGVRFTRIKRKHHCRSCGGVFCDACTNFQALVPTGEGGTQGGTKRVCQPCYNVLKQTQATGQGQDSDMQFVQVAIGKLRQDSSVQQSRYVDRAEILEAGLSRIIEDIRSAENEIADGSSLFTGLTHDIMVGDLRDLSDAFERRAKRARELQRTLKYHTMTAFFTAVQSRLLDVLLSFVVSATQNETTASSTVTVLDSSCTISCRNLCTFFLRQCGEGASARDLCEAMQDAAEETSLRITFKYEEQLSCLTVSSAAIFGQCVLGRILGFLKQDVIQTSKSRMPAADLLVDAVNTFQNICADGPIHLETTDPNRDSNWNDIDLIQNCGIKSPDCYFIKSEATEPHKYYYVPGTAAEASERSLTKMYSRGCVDPIFNLDRAIASHRELLDAKGNILASYFMSKFLEEVTESTQENKKAESIVLLEAIDKVNDLLRDPTAYGNQLLEDAKNAQRRLQEITEEEQILVKHSRNLVEVPEALVRQASYIKTQHEVQQRSLNDFIEMFSDDRVIHRAYALEALPEWPDTVIGGTKIEFNDRLLFAVDAAIASDRTGIRPTLYLIDESSHIVPRFLLERFTSQIPRLASEGIHIFADCCLSRLLHALPQPQQDTEMSPRNYYMGTGTIKSSAASISAQQRGLPLSAATCLNLFDVSLEQTIVGQRHVVLPMKAPDRDINWKEESLVMKPGLETCDGKRFTGKAENKSHYKPEKYGYVRASKGEVARTMGRTVGPGKGKGLGRFVGNQSFGGSNASSPRQRQQVASPSSQSPRELFPEGCRVQAVDMINLKDLNGQFGTVLGYEGDRVQIAFPEPWSGKALQSKNVIRVDEHGNEIKIPTSAPMSQDEFSDFPVSPQISPAANPREKTSISHIKSTLTCTPRVITAGACVNCVLVIRDRQGKLLNNSGATASELDVIPWGHRGIVLEAEPRAASDDGSTFQFTLQLKSVGTFPVGVAFFGKCTSSNSVTVVAGPIDWLGRSVLSIAPDIAVAGDPMRGRVELRDQLGNLATSAGLEDFTVSVHNVVDLATTPLSQQSDGSFEFSFIPTEDGDVDVEVGFCGLLKQPVQNNILQCRAGTVDFKNTLIVLETCDTEVGSITSGIIVLRDLYGNRAWLSGGTDESAFTLACHSGSKSGERETIAVQPVRGEDSEFEFEFKCKRKGLTLLECESVKSKEKIVSKMTVSMPNAQIDWENSTVSLVPREVQAGHTITCTILARDAYGNLLSEMVEDSVKLSIFPTDTKHGPLTSRGGTITCCFEPLVAGTTYATVQLDDFHQADGETTASKKSNEVLVTAGALCWEASTVEMAETARVAESVPVYITARDKFGNQSPMAHKTDFQVIVWNEGQRLESSPISGDNGKFLLSFEPRAVGSAHVEVHYSGEMKSSNSCNISAGAVVWEHCRVTLDRHHLYAGEVVRCDVTLADKYGNITSGMAARISASDLHFTICSNDNGSMTALRQATNDATDVAGIDGGHQYWFQFSPTEVCRELVARISYSGQDNDSNSAEVLPDVVCWQKSVFRFERELVTAGCELRSIIEIKDRFGNATERLPSGQPLKQSDINIKAGNFGEVEQENLALVDAPSPNYGTLVYNTTPKLMGEIRAYAELNEIELSAKCTVTGGGIDWGCSAITLNPSEITAGEEAYCLVVVKDRYGNETPTGPEVLSLLFVHKIWNESNSSTRISDLYRVSDCSFSFTSHPTRSGTALASVTYQTVDRESNIVHVKPGPYAFENTSIDWSCATVFAGDHLEGTITFRDQYGNPTKALPPNEIKINLSTSTAFIIDDYVSAAETTQIRFYCEPTKSGIITIDVTHPDSGQSVEGPKAEVKCGAVDWSQSTSILSAKKCKAGETITGVITCRDKFGNLATPGNGSVFGIIVKTNGRLVVSPTPHSVKNDASVFHFEMTPTAAGKTDIEISYNPQPLELPHKLILNVDSGGANWSDCCSVTVQEREVVAGGVINFLIHIKDAHGNPTSGCVPTMFQPSLRNSSSDGNCSTVALDKSDPSEATFTFTAAPRISGDAYAIVSFKGKQLKSGVCKVTPDMVFFPKCSLTVPDSAKAGIVAQSQLQLKDKYGNPTNIGNEGGGGISNMDFIWKITNTSVPSEANPRPQTKEIQLAGPVTTSSDGTQLCVKFEPHWKGSATVTCSYSKDSSGTQHSKNLAVEGGDPDTKNSTIKCRPTTAKAGEMVTVEVLVRDCHKNSTPFDLKRYSASINNERESPSVVGFKEIPGGFRFSFTPTKQGKAKVKVKDKNNKVPLESIATVLSSEFCPQVSSVKLEPSAQVAGRVATAIIQLKDKYKNSLSSDAEGLEALISQIKLHVNNGHSKVTASECKLKGTALYTEFEPVERGTAQLQLSMPVVCDDVLSSNVIEVRPAPLDFNHCSIIIDTDTAPVDTTISMVLTTKDKFNNITTGARAENFKVEICNEGRELAEPKLLGKDKSSTAFTTQFSAACVGSCYCEVTFYPPEGEDQIVRRSNTILITT